ncbi:MAG: redoxin domain-containing protein [Clostridiales bacterium]|nr:redoxin domain-containing protein [Clostridiales bacterium]
MKLEVGQYMPNFLYNTPYNENINYLENIKGKKSVLLFLRYYGCTVCQLDLIEIQENIGEFNKRNIDIKVVLQSSIENMKKNLEQKPLDYEIICDPLGELYKKFDIKPAKSKIKLGGGNTLKKIQRARKAGLKHGEYEGDELQLPAIFIVDESGKIIYSHYAENVAGIPRAKDILNIVPS